MRLTVVVARTQCSEFLTQRHILSMKRGNDQKNELIARGRMAHRQRPPESDFENTSKLSICAGNKNSGAMFSLTGKTIEVVSPLFASSLRPTSRDSFAAGMPLEIRYPSMDGLSEEASSPEAPFGLFRDWQRTQTQSFVRTLRSLRQQIDVRFYSGNQKPRGHHCVTADTDWADCALSRARRKILCFSVNNDLHRCPSSTTIRKLATCGNNPGLKRSSPATHQLSNCLTSLCHLSFATERCPIPQPPKLVVRIRIGSSSGAIAPTRRRYFQMN